MPTGACKAVMPACKRCFGCHDAASELLGCCFLNFQAKFHGLASRGPIFANVNKIRTKSQACP